MLALTLTLRFEFDKRTFEITRKRSYTFNGNSRTSWTDNVAMFEINKNNGGWTDVPHYQQLINRAIPEEMAPNFIFHGEKRVSLFATHGTHKEVGEAIRNILGCHVIETAVSDLTAIEKKLSRNIARESGDIQVEDLQRSIDSFERQLEDIARKIQDKEDLQQSPLSSRRYRFFGRHVQECIRIRPELHKKGH